jgi:hypothetical protein
LLPAIRSARALDESKRFAVVLPFRRSNAALKCVVDVAVTVKVASYARHQLKGRAAAALDSQLIGAGQ